MLKKIIMISCFALFSNISIADQQDYQNFRDKFRSGDKSKALELIEQYKNKLIESKVVLTAEDNYWLGALSFENNNVEDAIKY